MYLEALERRCYSGWPQTWAFKCTFHQARGSPQSLGLQNHWIPHDSAPDPVSRKQTRLSALPSSHESATHHRLRSLLTHNQWKQEDVSFLDPSDPCPDSASADVPAPVKPSRCQDVPSTYRLLSPESLISHAISREPLCPTALRVPNSISIHCWVHLSQGVSCCHHLLTPHHLLHYLFLSWVGQKSHPHPRILLSVLKTTSFPGTSLNSSVYFMLSPGLLRLQRQSLYSLRYTQINVYNEVSESGACLEMWWPFARIFQTTRSPTPWAATIRACWGSGHFPSLLDSAKELTAPRASPLAGEAAGNNMAPL